MLISTTRIKIILLEILQFNIKHLVIVNDSGIEYPINEIEVDLLSLDLEEWGISEVLFYF